MAGTFYASKVLSVLFLYTKPVRTRCLGTFGRFLAVMADFGFKNWYVFYVSFEGRFGIRTKKDRD